MFNKYLFILAHQVGDFNFYPTYNHLLDNQWKTYNELKADQEKKLTHLINFSYTNIPYYHNLFKSLNINPEKIKKVEDLEQLPIMTKETIKSNWNELLPVNFNEKYYDIVTGGSTGTPLKFRISKYDRFVGGATLYRGWGYGNYHLGDSMVFLAGASLDVGSKTYVQKRMHEISRNIKKLSSMDMGENEMHNYVKIINTFKPKFIRGYASAIYFFSKWIEENDIKISQPLNIFTTAEKLYPNMKEKISLVFGCDVFDNYGLNDGGISAFECPEHSGLHIDSERSITEVVDKNGMQIEDGIGDILATNLCNYAMPLIRYYTGDMGNILPESEVCNCGRGHRLMKEIIGREKELLVTPSGKYVHGAAFFTYLLSEIDNVNTITDYQIVQLRKDYIIINLVAKDGISEKKLNAIKDLAKRRSDGWNIDFNFVDRIEKSPSGKYKFIVNKIDETV